GGRDVAASLCGASELTAAIGPKPRMRRQICATLSFGKSNGHPMSSRKLTHQFADPLEETSQIRHQISRETGKGNLPRRDHEQGAQKQQVHHINKNEGKKCSVIAQIGLVFRNHPTGEGKVKGPGNAERRIEELAVGGDVEE